MAFCGNCGKEMKDDVKFCPSCGASVTGKPAKQAAQAEEIQGDQNDAEQNKGMAIIAYILFFVPLLTGDHKKSPFVKFHTNQGTVLFLTWLAFYIGTRILSILLFRVLRFYLLGPVYSLVVVAFGVTILVLLILGIINALNGRMKPLPVIGKFTIIK